MNCVNIDKGVQCNTYLLNLPQRKNKAVECKENAFTKEATTQTKQERASNPVRPASSAVLAKLSAKIRKESDILTEDKECQSEIDTKPKSTQTELFAGPIVGEIEELIRSKKCYNHIDIQVNESKGITLSRKNGWQITGKMVDPISIKINTVGDCTANVIFQKQETFQIVYHGELIMEKLHTLLELLHPDYSFCHGVNSEYDCQHVSTVVKSDHPFKRLQSIKCPVWWKPQNLSQEHSQCVYCRQQTQYLLKRKQRLTATTPAVKRRRLETNSNYSVLKLTPSSKRRRLKRIRKERFLKKQQVNRLNKQIEERDFKLNHHQSLEMESIVDSINKNYKADLDATVKEHDVTDQEMMRRCWEIDSEKRQMADTVDFFKDQLKNNNGERGNHWSSITYRLALAVYTRSKSAYDALRNFGILQLPSIKSLQNKSGRFLDSCGVNHQFLEDQEAMYKKFKDEKKMKGETIPNNVGVLIFDEVKVIDKVIWNSKNHEFVGLAMSPEEFPSLFDIFSRKSATSASPKPTKYILQFLWRDLSSNYDVIGPYFTSENTLEHKFVMGCMLETMRCFHSYTFKVNAIVCDGASENLALIKETVGHTGVFGYKKINENFDFTIKANFINPWDADMNVHWIICPSHQLKNMISALHSSRDSGSKRFEMNDSFFGWNEIEKLKEREDERYRNGQLRYEPGLLQSYIERDAWTRLNVKPSKIFQQENILSELFDFSHSGSQDSDKALQCYKYLRACNQLFEHGFLSKHAVRNSHATEVLSIFRGYSFFEEWIRKILENDANYNPNKPTQKQFLSWQTWDLLRVCVFGVKSLVEDFTGKYPGHFLVLSRINGSAVESLFSQFKYAIGSKLSAINYNTARKAVILKANIHGKNSCNKNYRDVPLYIRETNI